MFNKSLHRVAYKLLTGMVAFGLLLSSLGWQVSPAFAQNEFTLLKRIVASAGEGTLFRAQVKLKNPRDLSRLTEWGIKVLEQGYNFALVQVNESDLELLARRGYEPTRIESIEYLLLAQSRLTRATAEFGDVVTSIEAVMALDSFDIDNDGLTDTEEAWWCTDPTNPDSDGDLVNDGTEVAHLLNMNNTYGKPFIGWPVDHANCYDDDSDSIPDLAEIRVIGLNSNRESTDGDKFDDGQEFFGITQYPGHGALPRPEDTFITASMPGWVDPPGNSPFVAAYPQIGFEIIQSSIEVELVTEITTGESHSIGEAFSYATTNSEGTTMGTGKEESHTYSEWQEVGNSTADSVEYSQHQSVMESHSQEYFWEYSEGKTTETETGGSKTVTTGTSQNFSTGSEVNIAITAEAGTSGVNIGGSYGRTDSVGYEHGNSTERSNGESWSNRQSTSSQSSFGGSSGYEISRETGETWSFGSVQERSQSNGVGYESAQATTITREDYSEIAITNENQIATSQEWSTTTAVDTSRAADLTFGFKIHNTGTDNARQINNILFNIYIDGDRNPISTYAGVLTGDSCTGLAVTNFYPGETFPEVGSATQCQINLSLEQLALIDQGASIRVVVADFSYSDDEDFYNNAWGQGVIVEIDDDTADGDENIDAYLIPTWGDETFQEVIKRYFPVTETASGDILSVFTPEYDANHEINDWYEHAISGHSWWNVYLSEYGDGSFVPFRERLASPETHVLMRFNQDTDLDYFSDRAERVKATDLNNPQDHPNATVFAGYYEERQEDMVKVQMALENLGNFDAVGVQAMMYTYDNTVTVDNELVGMAGLIPSGEKILLTSKILTPEPLSWSGTAQPLAGGHYTGTQDNTYTFAVSGGGQIGSTGGLLLAWSDELGNNGVLDVGTGYAPPSLLQVAEGVTLGMGSGSVEAGDSFAIQALAPRDVFEYTINQEPYTQPLIIVSYNDPQGNKRFVTPVKLDNIHEDLWPHADEMLPTPELEIISQQVFQPGVDNQISFSVINPLDTAIEDGHLWIVYAESLTGASVLAKLLDTTLEPGPNVFTDIWNTNDFYTAYDASKYYKVKVFATDREYRPFDIAFNQFDEFGQSRPAKLAFNNNITDLGQIQKGTTHKITLAYANTGSSDLWVGLQQSTPAPMLSEPIVQRMAPGDTMSVDLVIDTGNLPLGPFTQTLTMRTNDPANANVTITVTGEIVAPNSNVSSYEYDEHYPWDEYIYVLGPQNSNTVMSYEPSIPMSTDMVPLYMLDDQDDMVGKSDVVIDAVGNQDITQPLSQLEVQTLATTSVDQLPEELIRAANDAGKDPAEAVELLEYRTTYSKVYAWPDGFALGISILDDEVRAVDELSSSTCNSNADGYVHWYYSGNYPQFGEAGMWIGNSVTYYKTAARSFIKFCLPSLPAYNSVSSATMYLYAYSPAGTNTIGSKVYRVTSNWSESAPFHATAQPGISGPVSTASLNKNIGWKSWNITSLVQDWYGGTPNYGVMVAADPENTSGMAFRTREYGTYVPYISVSFTLNPPASAPVLYAINNASGSNSYLVDWDSVANTTSYTLYEQKDGGAWNAIYSGASTAFNASGKATGTWCYKVRAVNSAGSSGDSSTRCTTVVPSSAPVLAAISNAGGSDSYTVSWSSVAGANTYTLQESKDGGAWGEIYSGSALNKSVTGRISGIWCYRINASNAGGATGWSNIECSAVNTAPNLPTNLLPENGSESLGRALVLSWADGGDTDNAPNTYREFQAQVENSGTLWSTLSPLSQNLYWLGVVPEDGVYTWKVQAFDGLETSGWTGNRSISVYSIAKTGEDQVLFALPEAVADNTRYRVQYGLRANILAAGQNRQMQFNVTKRTYESVLVDVILTNSGSANPTIRIDVGNNGQDVWEQTVSWAGSPIVIARLDIANALNNYLVGSSGSYGTLVDVPIVVSLDTTGEVLFTNLELIPGVDRDLVIDTTDVSFSEATPTEGSTVSVVATIRNAGYLDSGPVSVSFYAQLPTGNEWHVGSDFVSNVPAGGSTQANASWDTMGFLGNVPIRVVVDPGAKIPEFNENNNQANKNIVILTRPDLQVDSMTLSNPEPVVGETVSITLTVANHGQSIASPSQMALSLNGSLIDQAELSVEAESSGQITLTWVPSNPGLYRIVANADQNKVVSESNENNNQLWQDIYVGFADHISVDSGSDTDQAYTQESGYGYLESTTEASAFCGTNSLQTQRKDNDGNIFYRFDHLLPGHFYHLDVMLYECDGLGRQQTVMVDGDSGEAVDLSDGRAHQISIFLAPSMYADHTIEVRIDELSGYDAVVSEINLIDIDYRYADSGGALDPAYPSSTMRKYGWLDGVTNTTWGTLPHQSRRIELSDSNPSDDPDNELRYRFDGLIESKNYQLSLVFYQPSGGLINQSILVDNEQVSTVSLNGEQRQDTEFIVPKSAYQSDGSIVVTVRRDGALAGAFINEMALEEITTLISLPDVSSIGRANTNPTNAASVDFVVTFNKNVIGVDTIAPFDDFNLQITGIVGAYIESVQGNASTYTVTVNTGTGSGTIRLDVIGNQGITDTEGNLLANGFTNGEIYIIDKVAPDTSIDSHPTNPSSSTSTTFTFSGPGDATSFECKLDAGSFTTCSSPKSYSSLGEGSHTFSVRAIDTAGNVDASPASFAWTIDASAPDTSLDSHPNDPSNSASATFTFSGPGDTASFECKLDTGNFAACSSSKTYTGLGDGSHTFSVRAIDTAGNVDASPASFTWTVDTTAPETSIESQPIDPSSSTTATFTFSDSGGTASFECKLDTGGFATCSSPKTYYNLSDGSHTFSVRTIDTAGNVDASPASFTWTVDTTAPETSIESHPIDPSSSTIATFTFSDPGGTASFECKLDSGIFAACSSPKTYSSLGDGSHTFSVRAIDTAGNVDASPANFTWTVDLAPDTIIDSYPADLSNSASATFTFSGPGDTASFECKLDSGIFAACSSPKTYSSLGDGSHTFSVRAIDTAGNIDPTPVSYSWNVDTQNPFVASIDLVNANPTSDAIVYFTVTFSKPVTGVDLSDFTISKTGSIIGYSVTAVSGNGSTYTVTVATGKYNGTLGLDVINDGSIEDAAGNTLASDYTSGEAYTISKTYKINRKSLGNNDGWILESGELTKKGGTFNRLATTLRLGDNHLRKQYRSILSFNTQDLPDNAVITKVTLMVKKQGITGGGDPLSTFQGIFVDVRLGYLGSSLGLASNDFQVQYTSRYRTYGPFNPTLTSSWYAIDLTAGKGFVNKKASDGGATQIRLRFKLDDNNNAITNYLSLYSGNAPLASRPQLIIEYYVP